MKYIFFLILSSFILNVQADTFYTDYHLIESNSEVLHKEYLDNELYKIESKEGYNNYEEITTSLGYYPPGVQPSHFTYYDLNDYQEIISYSRSPYSKEDKIYNTNRIKSIKKVQSIHLRSFITSAYLRELRVYYKNEPLSFTYAQNTYNPNEFLSSNHSIAINLNNQYELEYLRVDLAFYDNTLSRIAFMLDTYAGDFQVGTPHNYYDNELYRNKYTENYVVNFLNDDDFNALIKKMNWIKPKDYNETYSLPYYKSSYYKYNYFITNRNYLNIYTEKPLEGYTLDYDDHKTLYDYYQREYIDIDDDLNIISSVPLDEINTYLDEEQELLIINYDKYKFYKKVELSKEEPIAEEPIVEEPPEVIVEEPIIEEEPVTVKGVNKEVQKPTTTTATTTKKETKKATTKTTTSTTTTTTTKPIVKLINEETTPLECPVCKDNSLKLKVYYIFNSVLLLVLSIMCKKYIFKRKKKC